MSALLKPLHLSTKLDLLDLKPLMQVRPKTKLDVKGLIELADTFYAEFEKAKQNGDEEVAYVQCGKYIHLILQVQKLTEYKKDHIFFNKLISSSKVHGAMDKMGVLSASLHKRYEEKKQLKVSTVNPPNGIMAHRSLSQSAGVSPTRKSLKNEISISVNRLQDLLQNQQVGVLIMDCRAKKNFAESHIILGKCVNVPEEIVKPGMTAGKILTELSQDGKILWASRSIKDHVILMDWNSKSEKPNKTVQILKDILMNWDPDAEYKNPLLILDGGYESFLHTYPMFVSNSKFAPTPPPNENERVVIEDIEYPRMTDIKMKDEVPKRLPPNVDRTSKAAMVAKTNSFVQETKVQFDETIKQIKEYDKQYDETTMIENSVPESDAKTTGDVLTQKLHLSNKIIELEDKKEHLLKTVQQSLEEQRAVIEEDDEDDPAQMTGRLIDDEVAASMETQAEIIGRMYKERAQFDRERKPLADRTKKYEADLEKTRRIEQRINIISKRPDQPTIDRSIKPSFDSYEDVPVYRNFNSESGGEGYGLTGLKNLGNTCYMNSIMQCLSNTPGLKDYFISDEGYRKEFQRTSKTQRQIAEEVSAVMREIWLNKHRHISSNDLRRVIGQCKQIFRGMDQQDSHEFLTILMDWLHLDLQPYKQMSTPNGKLTPSEKAWMDFVKCKESYIMTLFYGQIKSTVKCSQCQQESATYEGFSNLSLELPETSERCSIDNCLKMYFYGERISGWNCPKCKKPRDAVKKLDITKLPPILVIHFKRFNVDLDSNVNRYTKKQNFIDFPLTQFSVAEHIAPLERKSAMLRNTEYQLYGVSNHYGTMERGHYTAFCKNSHYGKWFKYDDHIVSPMDSSDVRSSAAYILFYSSINIRR